MMLSVCSFVSLTANGHWLGSMAGDVGNSAFVHLLNFSAWGQVSASKPPLRQANVVRSCFIFLLSARWLASPFVRFGFCVALWGLQMCLHSVVAVQTVSIVF